MKKLMLAISFLFLSSSSFAQGTPQYVFDLANQHFENKEYEDAKGLYKTNIRRKAESGGLFLNLGIIAVQEDSLGLAKYYFAKAKSFSATEEAAIDGLQFVESRFSRQSAVLPKLPWEKALDWIKIEIGSSAVFFFGVLLLNIAVILIVMSWFYPNLKDRFQKLSIASVPLAILIVSLAFYVDYLSNRYKDAVMIVDQSEVVERAEDDSNLVSLAYEGYSFTIDTRRSKESDDWTYVRMSNGLYGWVKSNTIKTL